MDIRALARVGLVGLALAVSLVLYLQWRPAQDGGSTPSALQGLTVAEPDAARSVRSFTKGLDVVKTVNGRRVFSISAAQHVDFVDGWNEWTNPRLTIHGRKDGGDVRVTSERMRTGGEIDDPTEVRMMGSVNAELPGGGNFGARRLDFDAVTGVVSGCNHNTLRYAGMEVRSDCLHFQTAGDVSSGDDFVAEVLRMWQNLTVRSAADGEGLPAGLAGTAEELRFRPGTELVTLAGSPRLQFSGTKIWGGELLLDVGLDANELRSIEAHDGARLRYATTVDAMPHVLRGDRIQVEFGDDAVVATVRVFSESSDAAYLTLAGFGRLYADELELEPGELGQTVTARGAVRWEGGGQGSGVKELTATALTLRLRDGQVESLESSGKVAAELATGEGEPARRFRGPRLRMEWEDGELAAGSWPEGVSLSAAGRELVAGRADFDGSRGTWILGGSPRPKVTEVGLQIEADELAIEATGRLVASDRVVAHLGGERLLAAAALFGSAPSVEIRNGLTEIDDGGRITMSERVQIVWESQSLVADRLRLETDPGRLHASGDIELVAEAEVGSASEATDEPQFITVTAQNLLVEQIEAAIRLAGDALLQQGERRIEADRITIEVDSEGKWSSVLAEEDVVFSDGLGAATGESMRYELDSGEILLRGSVDTPATFIYEGIEYRSTDALRVVFEDDQVSIQATEEGRTKTRTVPIQT